MLGCSSERYSSDVAWRSGLGHGAGLRNGCGRLWRERWERMLVRGCGESMVFGEAGIGEDDGFLGRMGEGCHFKNLTCGLAVYILYDSLSSVLDHGVRCVMTVCVIGHDRRAVLGVILAWVLVRRGFEGDRDTRVTPGRLFRVWIVDSFLISFGFGYLEVDARPEFPPPHRSPHVPPHPHSLFVRFSSSTPRRSQDSPDEEKKRNVYVV
jgi:hypothetical protein